MSEDLSSEYYKYNFHNHSIQIYNDWLQTNKNTLNKDKAVHRNIITSLYSSLQIKNLIDVMWRHQAESEDNQKLLKTIEDLQPIFPNLKLTYYKKDKQNEEIPKTKEETYNKYITLINAERVYLGVARSFFSYLLRNSWYFDIVKELNTFSLIMANHLYFIRLILKLYVMLTIKKSNEFEKISYWDRAYGFLIANQRQFLNDFFWSIVLFSSSFYLYIKNTQIDKFFSQETTGLGINLFIGIALLFDVWNSARAIEELDENWNTMIKNDKELEDELFKHYQKIRRDKLAFVYYTQNVCAVNLISGILEIVLFIAENEHSAFSESLIHIIPFLNIALIGMMFVSQFLYLTRDYWDNDFQNLPLEEKNKIQIKAMSQAIEEALKVIIIAIVIFVIASQIPLGGIPQMLILALLTICMIALVKAIKDWLEPKFIESFSSSEDAPLPASN